MHGFMTSTHIKEEMGRSCRKYGGEKKYVQGFGAET
jgi:hypothetical protein